MSTIVAAAAWLAAAVGSLRAQDQKLPHVDARTAKLLKFDDDVRAAFEKRRPGVLPEGPLKARLPNAKAKSFDWCTLNQDYGLHDQGKSLSCWANAAVEALECNWLMRNGVRHSLSPQPILDHSKRPNGGNGGIAFEWLLTTGTAPLKEYAFTGKPGDVNKDVPLRYRAIAWGAVQNSRGKGPPAVEDVKAALLEHGPMVVSVFSTKAFQKYAGGVFAEHYQPGEKEGATNHDVLLLGWDDKAGKGGAWKIKNSWGEKWGDKGYMWIEYGCNNICHSAWWVRAQSTYYKLPEDEFRKILPDAAAPTKWKSPVAPSGSVASVKAEHNVARGGGKGMVLHVKLEIGKAKGFTTTIAAFIEDRDGKALPGKDKARTTTEGAMRVMTIVVPDSDDVTFDDIEVFLPYSDLPEGTGKADYRYRVNVYCDGEWLHAPDKTPHGTFTYRHSK